MVRKVIYVSMASYYLLDPPSCMVVEGLFLEICITYRGFAVVVLSQFWVTDPLENL